MRSFEIALLELKRLVSERTFRLAVAVVCLVPLLYGVLYLWAFWDPYERLDKLPSRVALVVEDRPAQVAGKTLAVGNDLVASQPAEERDVRLEGRDRRRGGKRPAGRRLLHDAHRPARLQHAPGARRQRPPAARGTAGARQRGNQPARQPDRRARLPRGAVVTGASDLPAVPRPYLRGPRGRPRRHEPRERRRPAAWPAPLPVRPPAAPGRSPAA